MWWIIFIWFWLLFVLSCTKYFAYSIKSFWNNQLLTETIVKVIITFLLLLLHWIPRVLCILFAGLVLLLGNFILPLIVIVILILSWRWSWIGGIIFLLAGIAYMIDKVHHWDAIIYIPLFLIGVLYLLSWFLRKEIIKAQAIYSGEETEWNWHQYYI